MVASRKYPDELRERAVRLYRESDPRPAMRRLAEQLNLHPEALRNWIRQDEADRGQRVGCQLAVTAVSCGYAGPGWARAVARTFVEDRAGPPTGSRTDQIGS